MDEDIEDLRFDILERDAIFDFLPASIVSPAEVIGVVAYEILVDGVDFLVGSYRNPQDLSECRSTVLVNSGRPTKGQILLTP